MISMDSLTPKTQVNIPNSSPQDRSRWSYIEYKGVAAILDANLNYTFLPHIWNVYPSFFNLLWVPYKDQQSQLGKIWLHIGPPSAPWLTGRQRRCYPNSTSKSTPGKLSSFRRRNRASSAWTKSLHWASSSITGWQQPITSTTSWQHVPASSLFVCCVIMVYLSRQ